MGVFRNLLGTTLDRFKLGIGGPQLKNDAGDISARNTADSAYAAVRASLVKIFGDDIELNSGAAGAGADWKWTLRRPSTGMTHDLIVVMPATDPSPGQALTVTSLVGDVITLQWTTVAGGTDKMVADTTDIAFGSAGTVAMFTKPADAVVLLVKVVIDTPFDGTPSLSIGIVGTTSKYMPSTAVDLTAPAGTVFEWDPGLPAEPGTENLIATYAAGGAAAGAARVIVEHVIPS